MALTVGNLLTDPSAQSFISLADADAYLVIESIEAWQLADSGAKEASLARASRWLAASYSWIDVNEAGLLRVGQVAARLAAETIGMNAFAGVDTASIVESERVGPVAVSYRKTSASAAGMIGGMHFPWLAGMLLGLTRSAATKCLSRA